MDSSAQVSENLRIALVKLSMKPRVRNCRPVLSLPGISEKIRTASRIAMLCSSLLCKLPPSIICLPGIVFFFPFLHHLTAQFVSFSHSYTGSDCSHEVNLLIVFAVVQFLASSAAATLNISPVFGGADGCFLPSNCEPSIFS